MISYDSSFNKNAIDVIDLDGVLEHKSPRCHLGGCHVPSGASYPALVRERLQAAPR